MIHKAKFENFKGLRSVEVIFDSRFTVLVGPNGSGKTSVLQGIELAIREDTSFPSQNVAHLRSNGSQSGPLITLLDSSGRSFSKPTADKIRQPKRNIILPKKVTSSEKKPCLNPVIRPMFRASEIAKPSLTISTPPSVAMDGTGLPSLLGFLKLRDDELFDRIEECFCRVIPNVRKLRVDRIRDGESAAGETLLFDTTMAAKVPADQMSDGTLYILALVVGILGPHRPETLLIDDLDLRLHPKAQYELVTLLKQFLDEFPDLQIIATSHSPYILDKLEPNEVRVTALGEDGSVVVARLDEHPSFEQWKDSMSPGEFWSHTGEEWLKKLPRSAPAA